MAYPTQEDELRAKEARAEEIKNGEQSSFLATFQNIPKKNTARLSHLAGTIVNSFNDLMQGSRLEPYSRQEELMVGLKKLLEEQSKVIESRRTYALKINPNTAQSEEMDTSGSRL